MLLNSYVFVSVLQRSWCYKQHFSHSILLCREFMLNVTGVSHWCLCIQDEYLFCYEVVLEVLQNLQTMDSY